MARQQVFRVKIENADDIVRALERKIREAEGALREAAEAGAEVVRQAAIQRAPGPHIEAEVVEASPVRVSFDIGPDRSHFYYMFFEAGTPPHGPRRRRRMRWFEGDVPVWARHVRGIPARPFLRPAVDENKDRVRDVMGAVLRRKLGL